MPSPATKRQYRHPLDPIEHRVTDQPLACIQVNVYWLAFLYACVYPSRFPEAWLGDLDQNKQARRDVLDLLQLILDAEACSTMTGCCDGSDLLIVVQTRIDINGKIEISIDGGQTWHDSPNDPKFLVPEVPPITSQPGKTKCDAATNAVERLKDVQAQISTDLNTIANINDFLIACIEAVLAALLITLGAVKLLELVPVLGAYFRSLYGHTQAAYDALFTSQVWDAITCILYCNAEADGSYTEADFNKIVAQCLVDIPGGVSDFAASTSIQAMLKVWGVQGLNFAAATGSAALNDCASCNCTPCDSNDADAYSAGVPNVLTIVDAHTFETDAILAGGSYRVYICTGGHTNAADGGLTNVQHTAPCFIWFEATSGTINIANASYNNKSYDERSVIFPSGNYVWMIELLGVAPFTVRFHIG